MGFSIAVIGIGLFFFLLTCWALIDIARKDFGGIRKKVLWGVVSMIPFIGPIAYLAVGRHKGHKPSPPGA